MDEEDQEEDEEPKFGDLRYSKAHSSKTNNHLNQTNYVDEKEYDHLQLLEEFNVGFDDNVTLFTKMDFIKLNPFEKKCLGDLNTKDFSNSVTFSRYLKDEEEENFRNTNEYSQRTVKLVYRISFLCSNDIKLY